MELNDLLQKQGIDPKEVLILRHRPFEPALNKVLPWIAADRPEWFNAYQQTQGPRLEKAMLGASFVASFIGAEAGKALFIGLYSIGEARPLTHEKYWEIPAYQSLLKHGMKGFTAEESRETILWFDLKLREDFYASWKGRLIVGFPPPERAWWRRADRNVLPVLSVLEDSALDRAMPDWDQISWTWDELRVLPTRWKVTLGHWRAVYYIFDTSDGKGYVGSAYGEDNLAHRWENYAVTGHGGNTQLKKRNPKTFIFTILQLVSPTMSFEEIVRIETSWKDRLHTRYPQGLNDN